MSANPPTTVLAGDVAAPPHQFQHPTPFIKSPYNYDTTAESDRTAVGPGPHPSLTVQSQSEDADLNVLMKRFGVTGKMPESVRVPTYGDFTDVGDFRSSLDAIREAQANFDELPYDVKIKMNQSPQVFLDFCDSAVNGNADNLKYLRDVGLAKQLEVALESASSVSKAAKPEAQSGDVKK